MAGGNLSSSNLYLLDYHIYAEGIEPTRKQAIEKAKQNIGTSKQIIKVWKVF
ncbi:MAG TPA: hypothetical protein VMQ58_00370 [Candidatus Saccharimonadales bacterium]|nr:hypothetical protein [Candidatus Saccharimonadales bacterium]